MSDTPRTDAECKDICGDAYMVSIPEHGDYVSVDISHQLERELQEAQAQIRLLIAERDSARAIADQNWKLREEFTALLGTSDVKEGAHIVRTIKSTLDMLCDAGAALRNFTLDEVSRAKNWDRLEKKARELV